MSATTWPPPYEGMVAAPAGEPASAGWLPSKGGLDYTHRALQVVFLLLALIGVLVLLGSSGPRAVVRGAARKHAVES